MTLIDPPEESLSLEDPIRKLFAMETFEERFYCPDCEDQVLIYLGQAMIPGLGPALYSHSCRKCNRRFEIKDGYTGRVTYRYREDSHDGLAKPAGDH